MPTQSKPVASVDWKDTPLLLENVSPMTDTEAFEAALPIIEDFRKDGSEYLCKLYVDGTRIEHSHPELLPASGDRNFEKYYARLAEQTNCASFLLYIPDLQRNSAAMREKVARFLDGLGDEIVLPQGPCPLELFVGKYRATDGGIHREQCANFQFILKGPKSMRYWHPSTWHDDHPDVVTAEDEGTHYRESLLKGHDTDAEPGKALDLTGGNGAALYWPAGWWHVGLSPAFSISTTLALYPDRSSLFD